MRLVGVIKEGIDLFGSSVVHNVENKPYDIDMGRYAYVCIKNKMHLYYGCQSAGEFSDLHEPA